MINIKKITSLIFLLLVTFLVIPTNANAHVLKTSGSVGAVVHVTPEDDPIAGEATDFYFDFKDTQGRFKAENCDCTVTILKAGQEAYSAPLFQNNSDPSLTNVSFSYTFPEKNIYQVKISGKPLTSDVFQEFNLEYDIRVARISDSLATGTIDNSSENQMNSLSPYILPIGIIVILGILAFIKYKKK